MSESHAANPAQDESRFCPDCGYELRGITSARCPECGMEIDWSAITSPIPWEYRRQLGRLAAFNRTTFLAAIRPKKITSACAGPVDYRSARRFRWIVVALVSLPLMTLLVTAIVWQGGSAFLNPMDPNPIGEILNSSTTSATGSAWECAFLWSAGATLWPILPIGIALTFLIASGIAGIWFRSGSLSIVRRQRAVSVSQYACAPLAWVVIPLAVGTLGGILDGKDYKGFPGIVISLLFGVGMIAIALIVILWWWNTLRIFKRSMQPGAARLIVAGATIPILWLFSAMLGLFLFPALVGLAWIMIDSLR